MMPPADLRGRSLLGIFAHPDDESITCGGLLAWCAHLGRTSHSSASRTASTGSAGTSRDDGAASMGRARARSGTASVITGRTATLLRTARARWRAYDGESSKVRRGLSASRR